MARIGSGTEKSIFRLNKWLGLNESPDGDTGLKTGEAARMRNFRITREQHLQLRPGYAPVCTLAETGENGTEHPVRGLWYGYVAGVRHLLCACNGHLWDVAPGAWTKVDLGAITDAQTSFFGFSKKVYLLTGTEYYCWSGVGQVQAVEGYIPTVATASQPMGGGTLLEGVNKLNGKRKQIFSPDGPPQSFI